MVYIDFKMKFEPQRFRESTLQFYGKAGMSLHGSAAFYRSDRSKETDYSERMKRFTQQRAGRKGANSEVVRAHGSCQAARARQAVHGFP